MVHRVCYTEPIKTERMKEMLGVFMCYIMLQMVLLEGLWKNRATEKTQIKPAGKAVERQKRFCRDKAC